MPDKTKEQALDEIADMIEKSAAMPLDDRLNYLEHQLSKYPQLTQLEKDTIVQSILKEDV